ncbi:MAG: hypothetical protein J6C55_01800 [Oscillospiraceae bacterium]|nr:hypothetical protein [Oscillospiraceae bacterium]
MKKQKETPTKIKIIALILASLIVLSVVIPLFYKAFGAETASGSSSNNTVSAATSISSSSKIIVNYYKITDSSSGKDITELTKDSPAFDLTVGLLDPSIQAIDGFETNTGYAVLESASFYGETTNTGTLKQTGNTNNDGPMKLLANFKNIKFNGKTNTITIRVGYTNTDGEAKSELVSFMISQIPIDEEEDDDTKKDPAPPPSPRVVIDECTYGGNTINTEQSFTLKFNYFNSSNAVKMENLKIEVSGGENFVIKNNTNTFYVDELGPKGIKNQSVDFTALKSIKESSSYPINLKFSYEYVINKERKSGEDMTQIYIPVHKVVPAPRLTISDISCSPTEIEEEEESTVTIQLANKGESDVKNVSIAISGNFKSDSYVKEIGTIPSGKVTSPTFTITTLPVTTTVTTASNINSSSSNKSRSRVNNGPGGGNNPAGGGPGGGGDAPPPNNNPGNNQKSSLKTRENNKNDDDTNEIESIESTETTVSVVDNKITGTAVITFEDDDGNQHTIDRSFGLNVNVSEDDDFGMMGMGGQAFMDGAEGIGDEELPEESSKKLSTPILIAIISGGVIIVGAISYFIIKKIIAKRRELLDEDI